MTNNHLADISAFEQLQTKQDSQSYLNSLSVFNSKEELERLAKQENDVIIQYNKARDELAKLEKTEKGTPQYETAKKTLDNLWKQGTALAKARSTMYKKDVETAKNETNKELTNKLGELLKASSTTLESPFEK
jgi:hypothetical protein